MGEYEAVALGVEALGSLLGFSGQASSNKAYLRGVKDTNATNLQISRETNRQNLDMMREQNDWNLNQWNRENEYNSPVAQRARLIRAGINPAAIASAGSASSLQSVAGSPAQASKMEAPQPLVSPWSRLGGDMMDTTQRLLAAEQVKQAKLKTARDGIDMHTYAEQNLVRLYRDYAELSHQHGINSEQKLKLEDLKDEIRFNQSLRNKTLRGLDAEYDNILRTGRKLDAEANSIEHETIRLDKESVARISSMDASTQVSWYNAKTSRIQAAISDKIADADIALKGEEKQKAIALTDQIKQAVKEARTTEQLRNDLVKISHEIGVHDLALKIYATTIAQIEAQERKDLQGSEIRKALMSILGVDTSRFLQFAK